MKYSFSTEPAQGGDSDVRTTYCAFAISSMLDDWSGVDVERAISYISTCRVRTAPSLQLQFTTNDLPLSRLTKAVTGSRHFVNHQVSILTSKSRILCQWFLSGGPTYCALACLHLAPSANDIPHEPLTAQQRKQTIRWLIYNQDESGGFRGRTGKEADACYCFWCGASLEVCD